MVGSIIGAGADIAGSLITADAQRDAAKEAADTAKEFYYQTREDYQPYRTAGGLALSRLANHYGLGGYGDYETYGWLGGDTSELGGFSTGSSTTSGGTTSSLGTKTEQGDRVNTPILSGVDGTGTAVDDTTTGGTSTGGTMGVNATDAASALDAAGLDSSQYDLSYLDRQVFNPTAFPVYDENGVTRARLNENGLTPVQTNTGMGVYSNIINNATTGGGSTSTGGGTTTTGGRTQADVEAAQESAWDAFLSSPEYRVTQEFTGPEMYRSLGASQSAGGATALDAAGNVANTGAMRSTARYAADLGLSTYGDYANRLSSIAGLGQSTTTSLGSLGASYSNDIGSAQLYGGAATASGYSGAFNAISGLGYGMGSNGYGSVFGGGYGGGINLGNYDSPAYTSNYGTLSSLFGSNT